MSPTDLAADARILWRMACGQSRHGDQTARLQNFYDPQAEHYDAFRERLLHGRAELLERLEIGDGMRVVELGRGTGSSLERMGPRAPSCASIQLVDLCPALLAMQMPAAWTDERRAPLPYLPVLQAPYYLFVGHRDEAAQGV